jgi:hypothetical protein
MLYYRVILEAAVLFRRNTLSSGRRSVTDDWLAILPRDKNHVFDTVVRRWERIYAMMSVALDDALSLRARGELVCARQQVSTAADLLERLSPQLVSFCDAVSLRGRQLPKVPNVEPLNSAFFRGETGRSAAAWNEIYHRIYFSGRLRFFRKVRYLTSTIAGLAGEFQEVAGDISKGLSTDPVDCWKKLESLHYDLNTCLRETEVLLKAYLCVLPAEQLAALAIELDAVPVPKPVVLKPSLSRASA